MEKLHECAEGAIWSHVFQKGAIVHKRLKTSALKEAQFIETFLRLLFEKELRIVLKKARLFSH